MLSDYFESYKRHGVYLRGWDPKTVAIYERAFADLQTALRELSEATPRTLLTRHNTLTRKIFIAISRV